MMPRHRLFLRIQMSSTMIRRSSSSASSAALTIRPAISRTSTPKGHGASDRVAIRHDGTNGGLPRRNPSTRSQPTIAYVPTLQHRPLSATSSFSAVARSQSPYQGATDPSHPYAMYPQGIGMARTPSVATSFTMRMPQRTLSGVQRPAHPYAMYPQNVSADPDDDAVEPNDAVPVGFPGLGQQYHRRIGPEGEEQDIVGPDGHTEQLPPYSRYPDEELAKPPVVNAADPAALEGASRHDADSHDTLIPLSLEDAGAGTAPSQFPRIEAMESGESDASEKSWNEKTLKEKRKTRLCWGKIPLWWIILAAAFVVLLAIILGGVIGGFLSRQHANAAKAAAGDRAVVTVTSTALYLDASTIPTPSSLPPLPTGNYVLSMGTAEQTDNSCLSFYNQSNAWGCTIPGPPNINVGFPSAGAPLSAWLSSTISSNVINYGTQPPQIPPNGFALVQDIEDPGRGPAFFFQTLYDKIVVVSDDDFSPGGPDPVKKRQPFARPPISRKQLAIGEQPWFCFWNQTVLELFIYATQNASHNTNTSAAVPTTSTTPVSSSISSVSRLTTSSTIVSSASISSPSSTITTFTDKDASYYAQYHSYPSNTVKGRDVDDSSSGVARYPRVVKIEERRVPGNSIKPYCQRMEITKDGSVNVVLDTAGKPIIVTLAETDPSYPGYPSATATTGSKARRGVVRSCHCQWLSA
ncbi:hypothetical protein BJ546DRAFT_685977 [Cryomyces antarcticus]